MATRENKRKNDYTESFPVSSNYGTRYSNMDRRRDDRPFRYRIVKSFEVLARNNNGWAKELNVVQFNDRPPKLDIREWNEDHSKMSRGCSFTFEESMRLKEALNSIDVKMLENLINEDIQEEQLV